MPRIILSWILLIWITCAFLSIVINITSFLSPHWLIRIETPETRRLTACPHDIIFNDDTDEDMHNDNSDNNNDNKKKNDLKRHSFSKRYNKSVKQMIRLIPPSIGPWLRCQSTCSNLLDYNLLNWELFDGTLLKCQLSMWGFGARPAKANQIIWLTGLVSMTGCCLLCISLFFIVLTLCKREICDHSVFSWTGSLLGSAAQIFIRQKSDISFLSTFQLF
ncbi:unnamed protein product [Heterobilharzia americana]|nr:unnamed protein product [Heterobilharzia americana]